ncbi:ABC transporter ATP-binding protein [Geodermatophilus sp. SYSU D00710]
MTGSPDRTRGAALGLAGVTSAPALDGVDLDVAAGELVALLDPAGTHGRAVLDVVAGVARPDAGQVVLAGRDVTGTPTAERAVARVTADPGPARFRTVAASAVPRRGADAEPAGRAAGLLDLVGLAGRAGERVRRLSPPDRLRLALVRALTGDPQVLLLDEPFARCGGVTQRALREELRRLQLRAGVTTLLATSDAAEALAVADRVAVLRDGRVEQVGTPDELYQRPATVFVAESAGTVNRIPAVLGDGDVEFLGVRREVLGAPPPPGPATALVRPEALEVSADRRGAGRVVTRTFTGVTSRLAVALPDGLEVQADVPSATSRDLLPGTPVTVTPAEHPVLVTVRSPD